MAISTATTIADYFLWVANETGTYLSNLKLQKLVYYAQAWHLGIYGQALFDEDFEAWIHGPVIPSLYDEYKSFGWQPILKDVVPPDLSEQVQEFLEEVVEMYFSFDAYTLEKMTHREAPWIQARGNLPLEELSNAIIAKDAMKAYYVVHEQEKAA